MEVKEQLQIYLENLFCLHWDSLTILEITYLFDVLTKNKYLGYLL